MLGRVAIACACLLGSDVTDNRSERSPHPNSRQRCGVNSLFLLCRLEGIEVSASGFAPSLQVGMSTSLIELKQAAQAYGLSTSVQRLSREETGRVAPCIAHLQGKAGAVGHYVVVLNVTSGAIEYIDGTTAERVTARADWFDRAFSGHCLVPVRGEAILLCRSVAPIVFGLSLLIVCCFVLFRRLAIRSTGRSVILCLVIACSPAAPASVLAQSPEGFELGQTDLLSDSNSELFYLWYRCNVDDGGSKTYRDVQMALGTDGTRVSLLRFCQAARILGMQAEVRRCSERDLFSLKSPVIAHVDTKRGELNGGFVLMLAVNDRMCWIVEPGTLRLLQIRNSNFFRRWSGLVLIAPSADENSSGIFKRSLAPVLPILCLISAALWICRKAQRRVSCGS